jgi:FtsP/CotA-like multicopper oxidase with cupredoxin domain
MRLELTRRQVLAGGIAAIGGVAAPHVLSRAAATGRPLPDYPELHLSREGGRVRASIEAAPCLQEVAGRTVELLCYNGSFPGPLLRLRRDDIADVRFTNALAAPSNLHTHGLSVAPSGNSDNPFLKIAPAETFAYRFDLRDDPKNGGIFWYHPHYHDTDARQLFGGLAGPILVEHADDPNAALGEHDERVIVLKDIELGGGRVAFHRATDWLMGMEGALPLVNGLLDPVLQARERRLRLRIVNASNAKFWRLSFPGAEGLHVIGLDGHTLAAPQQATKLTLAPSQRADLVVDLPGDGSVRVIDDPVPRVIGRARVRTQVMSIAAPPGRRRSPGPMPRRLPGAIQYDEGRRVTAERDVLLSLFYICGEPYKGDGGEPLYRPRLGTREIWRVRNADTMDHPFHMHTWPFHVLDVEGRAVSGRPLRDTVNVRPGRTATLAVDFDSLSGRSLFHCHIAEHAAKGMMALLEVQS